MHFKNEGDCGHLFQKLREFYFILFLFHHIQENCTRKGRRKTNTVHIYARLRLKRKKKQTKKLSDYINNIYEFVRSYEQYYSDCMDITDINIIIRIYKWNEREIAVH